MQLKYLITGLLLPVLMSFKNDPPKSNLDLGTATPQAGSTIHFSYRPVNSNLAGAKDVHATLFYFAGSIKTEWHSEDVSLASSGDAWKGHFKLPDSATGFALRFNAGKEGDNNNGNGYISMVYKSGRPVAGAYAASALFYTSGRTLDITNKMDTALALFEKEFQLHPSLKLPLGRSYLYVLGKVRKKEGYPEADKWAREILSQKSLSEGDYKMLQRLFLFQEKKAQADSIAEAARTLFPTGEIAIQYEIGRFEKMKSIDSQLVFYTDFTNKFHAKDPGSPAAWTAGLFMGSIGYHYFREGNYDKAIYYISLADTATKYYYCANFATSLIEKGIYPALADSLAQLAFNGVATEILQHPGKYKTDQASLGDWKASTMRQYHSYEDTYAMALANRGAYDKALAYQKEVFESTQGDNPRYNEHYVEYLLRTGDTATAIQLSEGFIRTGMTTQKLRDSFKEIYIKQKGSEDGLTAYLAPLENVAAKKTLEDTRKEMIDQPAKEFTVMDLNGNKVSLAAYKGKVVVLDFWATWCGPCKASFPGMQKAINKYKDDKDVVFLFVDTWEHTDGAERKKQVGDFIKDNHYTFHVLLDNVIDLAKRQYGVVSDYGVSGIPTKFIISPDGKIKFSKIGMAGDDTKLVNELTAMIEMARGG